MLSFRPRGTSSETLRAQIERDVNIRPTLGEESGAAVDEGFIADIVRDAQRSALGAEPSSIIGRGASAIGLGGLWNFLGATSLAGELDQPQQSSEVLSAAKLREMFPLPEGIDSPFTEAMPADLAELIWKQLRQQYERQAILERADRERGLVAQLGMGMYRFMLDPVQAATTLIPGLGAASIESAAGRVMGPRAAALAGKAGSGFTAGALSQGALSAAMLSSGQYGIDEYSVAAAIRDTFFAAAINSGFQVVLSPKGGVLSQLRGKWQPQVKPSKPAGDAAAGVEFVDEPLVDDQGRLVVEAEEPLNEQQLAELNEAIDRGDTARTEELLAEAEPRTVNELREEAPSPRQEAPTLAGQPIEALDEIVVSPDKAELPPLKAAPGDRVEAVTPSGQPVIGEVLDIREIDGEFYYQLDSYPEPLAESEIRSVAESVERVSEDAVTAAKIEQVAAVAKEELPGRWGIVREEGRVSVAGDNNFVLLTPDGEPGGLLTLNIKGTVGEVAAISTPGGANSLGVRAMRDILRAVQEEFPQLTEIRGMRISGARQGQNLDAALRLPPAHVLHNKMANAVEQVDQGLPFDIDYRTPPMRLKQGKNGTWQASAEGELASFENLLVARNREDAAAQLDLPPEAEWADIRARAKDWGIDAIMLESRRGRAAEYTILNDAVFTERPPRSVQRELELQREGWSDTMSQPALREAQEIVYGPEGIRRPVEEKLDTSRGEREFVERTATPPTKLESTVPREAGAEGPKLDPGTFRTSKGSIYRIHADGTTTRNKSYHPEHGAKDTGLQPRSEATFYVAREEADAKLSIMQAKGGPKRAIRQLPDGRWAVQIVDGPNAGKFIRGTIVEGSAVPRKGLIPVELWNAGQRVHFGNEIDEIGTVTLDAPNAADPEVAAMEADVTAIIKDLEARPGNKPDDILDVLDEVAEARAEYQKALSTAEGWQQAAECLIQAGV